MRALSRLAVPKEIFITTGVYHYEFKMETVSERRDSRAYNGWLIFVHFPH